MKITNEDNMELMARYEDNYFDLAIVDPPYGINLANMNMGAGNKPKHCNKKRRGYKAKNWDLKKFMDLTGIHQESRK